MVKMRAYSITWKDCYCEEHRDLVLLPDELPKEILIEIAREKVEEAAGDAFMSTEEIRHTTYEKVMCIMDIAKGGYNDGDEE